MNWRIPGYLEIDVTYENKKNASVKHLLCDGFKLSEIRLATLNFCYFVELSGLTELNSYNNFSAVVSKQTICLSESGYTLPHIPIIT